MPGCDKSNFIFMCLPPHWLRRLQTLWMPVHIVQYIFIILQNIDFRPVVPCDILYRNLLLRYHRIQCILPPKLIITFMDEQLQLFAKAGDLLLLYPGNADILIFPNIEAANTFYKTITLFAGATTAGMLCGAVAPVVIASRADSAEAKMCSMLMACSLA